MSTSQPRHGSQKDQGEEEPLLDNQKAWDDDSPSFCPSATSAERPQVEYSYCPEYPRTGTEQHAIGLLRQTKQETIEVVQKEIPGLAGIDPSRLLFQIPIQDATENKPRWATVLDEAWVLFEQKPPKRLAIVVADLPGEAEKREWREVRYIAKCVGGFCLTIVCILGLAVYFIKLEEQRQRTL